MRPQRFLFNINTILTRLFSRSFSFIISLITHFAFRYHHLHHRPLCTFFTPRYSFWNRKIEKSQKLWRSQFAAVGQFHAYRSHEPPPPLPPGHATARGPNRGSAIEYIERVGREQCTLERAGVCLPGRVLHGQWIQRARPERALHLRYVSAGTEEATTRKVWPRDLSNASQERFSQIDLPSFGFFGSAFFVSPLLKRSEAISRFSLLNSLAVQRFHQFI